MSWIEDIQNEMIITTGDGKQYKPAWLNASKGKDYNISEFEFIGVAGTLVKRSKPKGRRYPMEIYFQGEDHLIEAAAFEKSADDERPWTIEHPLYNKIIVQPTSINIDNTGLNTSKITTTVVETLTDDFPKNSIDALDDIKIKKLTLDESFELSLKEIPTAVDVNKMKDVNKKAFNLSVPIIKLPAEFEEYFNLFNAANSAINTATASPLLAARAAIAVLSQPAKFTATVQTRVNLLKDTFDELRANVTGLLSVSSKQIHQLQSGSVISSMALAAVTPLPGNYTNSTSALNIIDILFSKYNQYLEDLDSLQSVNAAAPDSFIPDSESITQINDLVNTTIANLFDIVLSSKKERSIILEKDSNIILVTHRFYGLDPSDANINEFIANNDLGLYDLIQLKKGKKLVYYI